MLEQELFWYRQIIAYINRTSKCIVGNICPSRDPIVDCDKPLHILNVWIFGGGGCCFNCLFLLIQGYEQVKQLRLEELQKIIITALLIEAH